MKYLVVFLFALLLLVASPAVAQSERHREAIRLSRKLWRVIDITREYVPQSQVHVILEAPDRERLTLTFRTEQAHTLVRDDVITLSPHEFIPLSFWYDTPLISRYSDRRHHLWPVYGSLTYGPAPRSSWI
jgi:hypothetical protein